MKSSSCLLCGQPLSRIRVGGGEDFCSREHRNQYRLCRGMDRLSDAHKISTVIRRREVPKPLSQPFGWRAGEPRMAEARRILETRKPALRPIVSRLITGMPKSEVLRGPAAGRPPESQPLGFHILSRLAQPRYGVRTLRIAPPRSAARKHVKRTVQAVASAKKGLTTRVSLGVTFLLPRAQRWQFGGSLMPPLRLNWPEIPNRPTSVEGAAEMWTLAVPGVGLFRPVLREFQLRRATASGRPAAQTISAPVPPGTVAPREAVVRANHFPAPSTLRVAMRRAQVFPSFARPAHFPADFAGAHRIAAAPFAPQDPVFRSSNEE